tara:strand:+ start:60 stop:650 length:591 start_codon:yes stop_codon:yes gene_type:complete
MSFPDYTTTDTLDGTMDPVLLGQQIVADASITTPFEGVNTGGDNFTLLFETTPSAPEQVQCDTLVAAHSGLDPYQNGLVDQIKNKRDNYRLEDVVVAEYPTSSGNYFSCSIKSQDNWSKLSSLDLRGLVTYPFAVTTNDERGTYNVVDSADLSAIMGTVSAAVFAERGLAQTYIDAVLATTDETSANLAAQPYLEL